MIRVLVADDHPFIRRGVRHMLEDSSDLECVAEAEDGREALQLLREGICDVAVLDVSMPQLSGLAVLEQARAEGCSARIVIISMHPEEKFALRALRGGAAAYLTKDRAPEELVEAIRRAAEGRTFVTQSLAERMADLLVGGGTEAPHEQLSDRELEVVLRIARGMRGKDIANELCISLKTVATHRARALKKLGLGSNAELVRYVTEEGLIL